MSDYEAWVSRVADAIHETCRNEWRAIVVVDPKRQFTQHGTDAHYGMAHDLVRRLNLAERTVTEYQRGYEAARTSLDLVSRSAYEDMARRRDEAYQRGQAAERDVAALTGRLSEAQATIEDMSGDAADLHDLIGEAAALRTVVEHMLVRVHDSGCGTCDAARALLTAEHELPSFAAKREAAKEALAALQEKRDPGE